MESYPIDEAMPTVWAFIEACRHNKNAAENRDSIAPDIESALRRISDEDFELLKANAEVYTKLLDTIVSCEEIFNIRRTSANCANPNHLRLIKSVAQLDKDV